MGDDAGYAYPVSHLGSPVVEGLVATLIRMMLTKELVPGQRLRQIDLAKQLKVSRTPLREALQLLTADGLVTYRINRGHTVRNMSYADFQEVRRIRSVVEMQALTSITWPDEAQLQRLHHLDDLQWQAGLEHDFEKSAFLHRHFHDAILQLSRFSIAVHECRRMQTLSDLYCFRYIENLDALRESRLDHERMLRAVAEHDLEALVHFRRAHSRSFESEVRRQAAVPQSGGPRTAVGTRS